MYKKDVLFFFFRHNYEQLKQISQIIYNVIFRSFGGAIFINRKFLH